MSSTPSKDTADPETQAAETLYSKATKAELSSKYDDAFKLYIQCAEKFLHLSRSRPQSPETLRTKWRSGASKALMRAERIKAFSEKVQTQAQAKEKHVLGPSSLRPDPTQQQHTLDNHPNVRLTPVGINHFSEQEQFYVLSRGSRINEFTFPLWTDPIPVSGSSSSFIDLNDQPRLSPEQTAVHAEWRRPCPSFSSNTHTVTTTSNKAVILGDRQTLPQEILQHIVSDCSVCASIAVCLEHARRFGSDLARSAIYSADGVLLTLEDRTAALSLGENSYNENNITSERYNVKMFVNGAWRRIVIDDKLPYNPTDGSLMCMSVRLLDAGETQTVYWPSLLEKSYMKLMGGYDFPGSNSSIDLHAIAGWIPEQVETKSPSFEREKTWERIIDGFATGQCVITLGTGPHHGLCWRHVPLLASHSYAVIDITETETQDRIFSVLDSWVAHDDANQCSRILQIPWSELLYVFDGIYLSWDPQIWKHQIVFHGMWKRTGEDDEDATSTLRINFANANAQTDEEVWVLLTRHISDTRRADEYISLRVDVEDDRLLALPSSSTGAHSRTRTERYINAPGGTYTNSAHVLIRTRIPSSHRSGTLAVTASYEGSSSEIGYTVSAYTSSDVEVSWDETVTPPPFSMKLNGILTNKNAGGNCTYPTFMVNPQYHLRIHETGTRPKTKSRTKVILKTGKDLPVNVAVTWSKGERKEELVEQDVAANSGAYMYGLAQVTKDLTPGDYTVILSAFEPQHTGSYVLKVECSTPFDLNPIQQEGAGMYNKIARGAWDASTAGGAPNFQMYSRNPRFQLDVPSSAQIKVRLQLSEPPKAISPALNVSIFHSSQHPTPMSISDSGTSLVPQSPTPQRTRGPLVTSGAYDDALAGVSTPLVTLSKGRYEVIPSTYTPGVEAEFRMVVYSSVAGVEVKRVDF